MMKTIFVVFCLLICFCEIHAQNYGCKKLKREETTRQGYFSTVEMDVEESFKVIRGVVELVGEPTEDVFVEVFTDKNSKRIAGCKTGSNGRFSFPKLKEGNYTILLSKDGGFQFTKIKIKVSPKSKNKKEIIGVLEIGY